MKSLILRRRGHSFFHRQVRQELTNVLIIEVLRVALLVKKDVPFDPLEICLFSPQTQVSETRDVADLLQKFPFRPWLVIITPAADIWYYLTYN